MITNKYDLVIQRVKKFQDYWDLNTLKKMTLEQYSNKRDRSNFIYRLVFDGNLCAYIENDNITNSETCFGICKKTKGWKYKNKNYVLDKKDDYIWQDALGSDKKKAFEKIKSEIIKIAQYSKNNELNKIDNLDLLFFDFKWKIAFLYQSLDNMQMFNIFSESLLKKIADNELGNSMLKPSQIYLQILNKTLKDKPYEFGNVLEIGKKLRKMYAQNSNTAMQKDMQIQSDSKYQDKGEKMNDKIKTPPLNQILYGPPGTGKTYNTINKALEILGYGVQDDEKSKITLDYDKIKQKLQEIAKSEDTKALNLENLDYKSERELTKLLFDYYHKNEQIEFITFHQSFSYEEFVEGIKPIFVDENGNEVENSNNMVYKPKDGIFKEICERALKNLLDSKKSKETLQSEKNFKNKLDEFLSDLVENQTEIKKSNKGSFCIKDFDETRIYIDTQDTELIKFLNIDFLKNILRSNEQFDSAKQMWKKITSNKNQQQKSIYYFQLYKLFQEFKPQETIENINDKVKLKPYILIIDEINRGNISKILGELITLIEPSKRIGADEELRVSLPYSTNEFDGGNGFGVPKNLYIIGTMNTADRSIALLDTALRRRFEFVEMMPDCEHKEISTDCESVNLQRLLKSINDRIEFLLDREHTIGHSFFIGVDSMEALREVFGLKIIPLLQEYFYDDYAKIDAVLNGNGMVKVFSQSDLGVNLSEDFVDSEKRVYRISDSHLWNIETFNKIYKSNDSRESSDNE